MIVRDSLAYYRTMRHSILNQNNGELLFRTCFCTGLVKQYKASNLNI